MQQMAISYKWDKDWWGEYESRVNQSTMKIVTLTFCVKNTKRKNIARGLMDNFLKEPNVQEIVKIKADPGIVKRGRKPKEHKPFPNLIGNNLRITIEGQQSTIKIFKNGSVQVCGCPSFDCLRDIAKKIERFRASPIVVDVNTISVMVDFKDHVPLLREGKISCANLSNFMNNSAECSNWEKNDFHGQSRQTNLNVWYNDEQGKRHYAAIYPKGTARITTTNSGVAVRMFESLKSTMITMGHGLLQAQRQSNSIACGVE